MKNIEDKIIKIWHQMETKEISSDKAKEQILILFRKNSKYREIYQKSILKRG
jgi:hypothetical protein